MSEAASSPVRIPIGARLGLAIDCVAWDAVGADVDLSIAGMFTHEASGVALKGGLLHLDQALGGALAKLRAEGPFRAELAETLVLNRLPKAFQAKGLMIVGLGDPLSINPSRLAQATHAAFRQAARLRAQSVAFAPSLLDSGLGPGAVESAPTAMLQGLLDGIAAERRLIALGLSGRLRLSRWSFDAGASHIGEVANAFIMAFKTLDPVAPT